MQMMQKGLPGPNAARQSKRSVMGPMLPMYPSFPLDRRTYRRYFSSPLINSVSQDYGTWFAFYGGNTTNFYSSTSSWISQTAL